VEGIIAVAVKNSKAHNKIHINGAEAIEANSELFFVKKRRENEESRDRCLIKLKQRSIATQGIQAMAA